MLVGMEIIVIKGIIVEGIYLFKYLTYIQVVYWCLYDDDNTQCLLYNYTIDIDLKCKLPTRHVYPYLYSVYIMF